MTPLTLAQIRDTLIDATPAITAALLRDLDWMIRDGFDVKPPTLAGGLRDPGPPRGPDTTRKPMGWHEALTKSPAPAEKPDPCSDAHCWSSAGHEGSHRRWA